MTDRPYEAEAAARGFTLFTELTSDVVDLAGWVRPEADLDGSFALVCAETGETLRVNGWLFSVEG